MQIKTVPGQELSIVWRYQRDTQKCRLLVQRNNKINCVCEVICACLVLLCMSVFVFKDKQITKKTEKTLDFEKVVSEDFLNCNNMLFISAKLLGECINSDECPAKSSCLHRGCDGLKCVCQDNYMPSDDESRCVQSKYEFRKHFIKSSSLCSEYC